MKYRSYANVDTVNNCVRLIPNDTHCFVHSGTSAHSEPTHSVIPVSKRKQLQTTEGCNFDMSLNPLNSCTLMLQRCTFKRPAFLSLCHHFFYSSQSPTLRERFWLPQSPNPTPPKAYASVHHTFSILFLFFFSFFLFCFWDSGDIFKVPDPCLETLCMCPHLSAPPKNTHKYTHVESRYTNSLPGAGPLCACLPQRSWSLA